MNRPTMIRAVYVLLALLLGNLHAWDSNVHAGWLWVVLLVSLATGLPVVTVLVPLQQVLLISAIVISFLLLIIARLVSPVDCRIYSWSSSRESWG